MTNRLTGFSEPLRRRGRPDEITDSNLLSMRNDLYFILEQRWAFVGWELQQARTVTQVRSALEPLKASDYSRLEVFKREHSSKGDTSETLRKIRIAIKESQSQWRSANEEMQERRQLAERARNALAQVKGTANEFGIRSLSTQREQDLANATARLRGCDLRLDSLREDLKIREADFAQSELLKFVLSQRYRPTPLSFANAMAGLPFIGWRQSYKRCAKQKPRSSHGLVYEMFQIVARIAQPACALGDLVQKVRVHLLDRTAQKGYAYDELRKHWYHLKSAIESAYPHNSSSGAAPYRIFAEYLRRTTAPTALDLFLGEEYRL